MQRVAAWWLLLGEVGNAHHCGNDFLDLLVGHLLVDALLASRLFMGFLLEMLLDPCLIDFPQVF